jgi:hypothetical protein
MNQERRDRKKANRELGGKTHEHTEGERCYRCRPAKRPKVAKTPMRLRAVNRA